MMTQLEALNTDSHRQLRVGAPVPDRRNFVRDCPQRVCRGGGDLSDPLFEIA